MSDAQTEARAIARCVRGCATDDQYIELVGRIATALAAKDAELAAERAALRLAADRADRAEAQLAEANKALEALANFAFWFRDYPEFKPNPDFMDVMVSEREAARPFIPLARRAREQGGE